MRARIGPSLLARGYIQTFQTMCFHTCSRIVPLLLAFAIYFTYNHIIAMVFIVFKFWDAHANCIEEHGLRFLHALNQTGPVSPVVQAVF